MRSNLLTGGPTGSSHPFPPRPFVSEASPDGDVTRSSPPTTPSGSTSPRSSVDGDANGSSPGNVSTNTTRRQSTRREDKVPLEATAVEEGSDTPTTSAAKYGTKAEATERDSRLPFHGGELCVGDGASGSVPRRETPVPTADDASPNAAGCQLPLTARTSSRADKQARRPVLQKQQDLAREEGVVDGCCRQGVVPAGLLWSDFGGGREAGDSDAEETASREFAEESLGLFNGVRLQSDSVARSQVRYTGKSSRGGGENLRTEKERLGFPCVFPCLARRRCPLLSLSSLYFSAAAVRFARSYVARSLHIFRPNVCRVDPPAVPTVSTAPPQFLAYLQQTNLPPHMNLKIRSS